MAFCVMIRDLRDVGEDPLSSALRDIERVVTPSLSGMLV